MASSGSRRQRAAEEKLKRKVANEVVVLEFQYLPGVLRYQGPVIITGLTIAKAHRDALESAGHPIPPPVRCRFLIDTGADSTVVKHEFAEKAGLKLISDNIPLHGVGIDTTGRSYMGRIAFGQRSRIDDRITHEMFVDTQIMGGRLETDLIDGLIGRDVLQHFQVTYDGKTGTVRMRYYRADPSPGA